MTIAGDLLKGATEALAGKAVSAAAEAIKKKGPQRGSANAKKPKKRGPSATRKTEDRLADALHDLRRSKSDDPALDDFREELFAELRRLIPVAIRQARGSKKTPPRPALLRILTRYSR